MKVTPLNPYNDGIARTIKSQYQQSSMANFIRKDGLGATGVLCIENKSTDTTICLNSKVDGKQPSLEDRIYSIEGVMTACVTSFHPNIAIPQATKQGYVEITPGSVFDAAYPESTTRRGRVQEGGSVSPTLCTTAEVSLYEGVKDQEYRIRKLTPRECFRLMGVGEREIDILLNSGISNAQLYKMAGNSIVVDVLYHIFRKMFIDKENEQEQLTLF